MSSLQNLKDIIESYNISSDVQFDKFEKYMDGILEWNTKVNLTNITDREEFIEKHYIDSIVAIDFDEIKNAKTIIDVGTGGGFPGVPLAIIFPEKQFVLVDSLNKRLKIIDELTNELGIDNVTTVHGRAEELAQKKEYREKFDVCISRAVANLTSLSELCLPFVKVNGSFIAYKGPSVYEELETAEKVINLLGGKVDKICDIEVNKELNHKLLFVKKIKNTNKKYPRKPGEPVRNPIK